MYLPTFCAPNNLCVIVNYVSDHCLLKMTLLPTNISPEVMTVLLSDPFILLFFNDSFDSYRISGSIARETTLNRKGTNAMLAG